MTRTKILDRIPLHRAANWLIISGLVLSVCAVAVSLINAYQDKLFGTQFFGPGSEFTGWQRIQSFLQNLIGSVPWTLLVVAAGFALRAWAGRMPPAPAPPKPERRKVELPEAEPFPDSTLFLPPPPPQPEGATNGSANGAVSFAKPDDELWRH
jgi:hypothetical protein